VLSLQLGASSGLETYSFEKNSRGVLLWKLYLQVETRDAGMSVYLCMVPFTWILNFFMALMGNSSCFTALSEVAAFN
jgi:hypothetical protein